MHFGSLKPGQHTQLPVTVTSHVMTETCIKYLYIYKQTCNLNHICYVTSTWSVWIKQEDETATSYSPNRFMTDAKLDIGGGFMQLPDLRCTNNCPF